MTAVVTVPLRDVVGQTRPVYPEPCYWESTVEFIRNDAIEWEIVLELIAALERGESFREPVYVGLAEDAEFEVGESSAYVGDGTHRMVAHIIHGSEFVDVVYGRDETDEMYDDAEYDGDVYRVLCTTVEFEDELTDDAMDSVFVVLRSFKLTDELWVTSDVMSSHGKRFEFTWSLRDADDALIQKINEICALRIARHLTVAPVRIDTHYEEWDNEE